MKNQQRIHMIDKRDGWSASGTLRTFNPHIAVNLQKEFPVAGNYTVQFGVIRPPTIHNIRPEAVVTWSVNGNDVVRRITIGNGTSITGQAESVNVRVFDSLVTGSPGIPGDEYIVSAQVVKGIRANPGQQSPIYVPNTVLVGGVEQVVGAAIFLPAATTAVFTSPEGATQVIGLIQNGPVTVLLDNTNLMMSAQNNIGLLASWFPMPPQWVPLPPLTTRVAIHNRSAIALDVMALFGVDG